MQESTSIDKGHPRAIIRKKQKIAIITQHSLKDQIEIAIFFGL
jgi:hypothetical protein